MRSTRCYFISFLLLLPLVNNVMLDKSTLQSWMVQKIQGLETAVERVGCQQYLAHGYSYEHMYPIDGVVFDNVVLKKSRDDLTYFEMHLAIKTSKDGIILLSPTRNPGYSDLVFEIAIGVSSNQFTVLRLKKDSKDGEITRVNTQNILSTKEYSKFYIKISDDVLTFGKAGETPVISYNDVRLRTVKYFDMSSWGEADAKFLYDCPETSKIYCYYKSN